MIARSEDQPTGVEIKMADGIFIKQMVVPRHDLFIPQHSHAYDHVSMIARGRVRVWCDGELKGDYAAPTGILIPAHTKHLFQSLTDDVVIYCIHNISRTGEVEIAEEHQIAEVV